MTAVHGERLTIRIWPISSPTHAAFGGGCLPGLGGDPSTRPGASCGRIAGGTLPGRPSPPARAQARHDYDARFAAKYNLPVNEKIQELRRAIAQHGFDGVNVVAKKYGLPLAVVMLMVQQAMGEEPTS